MIKLDFLPLYVNVGKDQLVIEKENNHNMPKEGWGWTVDYNHGGSCGIGYNNHFFIEFDCEDDRGSGEFELHYSTSWIALKLNAILKEKLFKNKSFEECVKMGETTPIEEVVSIFKKSTLYRFISPFFEN